MRVGKDEYRRTIFDRQGPEAVHSVRTVFSLVIPIVAGALIGGALAWRRGYSPVPIILSTLGGSVVLVGWWWYFVTRVSHGAGKVFGEFIQPSGAGSYE